MWEMFQYLLDGEYLEFFILLLVKAYVLFCVLPIHEFAHAWAATKLGDQTPRLQGRLTLNPLAHLDLWGSLMILFTGFGYAKPVSVNIRNFKNRKVGFALTAAAGPLSNLIMALLYFFVTNLFLLSDASVMRLMAQFFYSVGIININLAVFNLLPIPPLDGSRLITLFLPNKYYYKILQYERYIMIALLVLVFSGILSTPLDFLASICADGIDFIASLPFYLIGRG